MNMQGSSRPEDIIKEAYAIIGRATPLKADCGRLCGAACCQDGAADDGPVGAADDKPAGAADEPLGGAADDRPISAQGAAPDATGMVLFPGEIALLSDAPGFRFFRIAYMGAPAWFLVCEGVCDRRKRPLACRIFPLAPHIDEMSSAAAAADTAATGAATAAGIRAISAMPDPRALRVCPLADGEHLDRAFRRAVAKAFRHLAQSDEIYEFMRMLSADLEDMRRFIKIFPGRSKNGSSHIE